MQKGGRMIVIQIEKVPLSLIFTKEKRPLFTKNTDLEYQKITLFQWKCLKKDPFFSNPLTFSKNITLFSNIKNIQKAPK